jgi:hypothetical protein
MVDREHNRVVKIECLAVTSNDVQWMTAVKGGMLYDYDFGWAPSITDPMECPVTGLFYNGSLYTFDNESVDKTVYGIKAVRLSIRNSFYDYESVEELIEGTTVPTSISQLSDMAPKTTVKTYVRYKVGAYYIAPYMHSYGSSCSVETKRFKQSYMLEDKRSFANNLTVYMRKLLLSSNNEINSRMHFWLDGQGPARRVEPVTPGTTLTYYNYSSASGTDPYDPANREWDQSRPVRRVETIDLSNDINEQVGPGYVHTSTSAYIDYAYWYQDSAQQWYYTDRKIIDGTGQFVEQRATVGTTVMAFDPTAVDAEGRMEFYFGAIPGEANVELVDSDKEQTLSFDYISNTTATRTVNYIFRGADKTTGIECVESGELSLLSPTSEAKSEAIKFSLETKNAKGKLTIFIEI